MSNTGNDNYLIFIFILENFSPAYPYEKQNRREIYKNFTTFTVTIPLVLPIGTKDSEKFTKKFHNIHSNSSTSPSHRHEGFGEIYENFTTVTVTVPLVLPTGMKDSKGKSNVST